MTRVQATGQGSEIAFADGVHGLIPSVDLPEIGAVSNLAEIELPNPYAVTLRNGQGEAVELPWDFARHYCDASYRPRVEAIAAAGRQSIGGRIRQLREAAGKTQEELAAAARIGRVTLVRIEKGDQSPRYDTLVALASALALPTTALLANGREDSGVL